MATPIYGASLNYEPIETTVLTVSANRQVEPSFFSDQVTRTTSWNASLNQRLLEHFLFTAGIGYQTSDYLAEIGSLPVDRSDNTRTYNLKLSTTLLGPRRPIDVFYTP